MRGITSWGKKKRCGGDGKVYGVYTNVSALENWIRGVIEKQPEDNRLNFDRHNPDDEKVGRRKVIH